MPSRSDVTASHLFYRSSLAALRNLYSGTGRSDTAFYVGSRRVPGLALPRDRTYAINSGNLWGFAAEAAFKLTGYAPALYQKIHQLEPALIHAHFGVNGALALPITKKLNLPV